MQNFELKKVGGARATHWHPYDYQIYSNFLIVFRIDGWRLHMALRSIISTCFVACAFCSPNGEVKPNQLDGVLSSFCVAAFDLICRSECPLINIYVTRKEHHQKGIIYGSLASTRACMSLCNRNCNASLQPLWLG